jgi:hypothetical protein
MRTKQDYVLNQKEGKFIPEKVGLKAVQRDGVDYEFTIVLDIDSKHFAVASKDRTGLFSGIPEFRITPETGKKILDWCSSGFSIEDVKKAISEATDLEELRLILSNHPEHKQILEPLAMVRKNQLSVSPISIPPKGIISNPLRFSQNGTNSGVSPK